MRRATRSRLHRARMRRGAGKNRPNAARKACRRRIGHTGALGAASNRGGKSWSSLSAGGSRSSNKRAGSSALRTNSSDLGTPRNTRRSSLAPHFSQRSSEASTGASQFWQFIDFPESFWCSHARESAHSKQAYCPSPQRNCAKLNAARAAVSTRRMRGPR